MFLLGDYQMKNIVILALVILSSVTSGFAQLDPDNDGIGVYFDPCACVNCITMNVGQHRAFLVITHPTSPLGVGGWECRMWLEGPAAITAVTLQGQAVNARNAPEYAVATVQPQINPFTYPAVVVAVLDFYILDIIAPVTWWIDGIYAHSLPTRVPAYLDGADPNIIKELRQSTGGPTFPVATVNGDCAVPVDADTWGGVKALFR